MRRRYFLCEIDVFKDVVWNNHRIREQKDGELPGGVPNHIFNFPEEYELENCGMNITDGQLREVAELSGVFDVSDDYLPTETRCRFAEIVPDPSILNNDQWVDAYMRLKEYAA